MVKEPTAPRDIDELEGTLLVPTAVPVDPHGGGSTTWNPYEREIPVESILAEPTEATTLYGTAAGVAVQDAMVIPNFPTRDPMLIAQHERQQTEQATQMGRILAQQEMDKIQWTQQNVNAINYYARREVEEANEIAIYRRRVEELGLVQTSAAVPPVPTNPTIGPTAPMEERELVRKPYEVSEYDVREYDTRQYETMEYKSVYDNC